MASTSAPRTSASDRIKTATSTLYADNQSLIAEIRKAMIMIKGVAVDLERDNQSEMVRELESSVAELLESSDECTHFSTAIHSLGDSYRPSEQLTDFKKVLENEVVKLKGQSPWQPQSHPLFRQFREAVWNVHHAGQPMPGEEQEDIVMTSTQTNLLNITCPLTGKPVTELQDPVRCMDCKHIYEKKAIMHYIKTKRPQPQCPVAGCPKVLQAERVSCDPLLQIEIDEMRSRSESGRTEMVEDCTGIDDD
ncbi:E3 SUMO-protein ligase MMS21 [Acorus gramineus]|uniref:E3 SUMO-protein ligase MMS21 n=1 Tax=Acorus gramineus TaxID=55184 RepID=A0AAV9BIC6_ACOGR|nr:E3 SUMO-protein ligase MMS21 [Acorus gramineus]